MLFRTNRLLNKNCVKKLLFIIPALNVGGTNSSLVSLVGRLKDSGRYEIKVFAMSPLGGFCFPYEDMMIKQSILLSALEGTFSQMPLFTRMVALLLKPLHCLEIKFRKSVIENFIYRKNAAQIEQSTAADCVIAFQEGAATHFVSHFKVKNKIAWIHCDYNRYLSALSAAKSEENIYDKYNSIVCVSSYTASVFQEKYPLLSKRVKAIYNLSDADRVVSLSKQAIEDNRFTNDVFTIISVGRICSVKRFGSIPEIAKGLAEQGLKFKWYIIGPSDSPSEVEKIKEGIRTHNIEHSVEYLGNKPNPFPYYRASNLLVSLSSSEACPMIFNEAKILGLPTVSTDFASAFEFIKDGFDGFIAPIEEIGDRVSQMIANRDLYLKIRANTEAFSFDNTSIMKKVEEIL